jgi:hypothetical protein
LPEQKLEQSLSVSNIKRPGGMLNTQHAALVRYRSTVGPNQCEREATGARIGGYEFAECAIPEDGRQEVRVQRRTQSGFYDKSVHEEGVSDDREDCW